MQDNTHAIYDRVRKKIFSGSIQPGSRLVERQFATELGVSRVPVRETFKRMVAQGVLLGGEKGQGVRMREYTVEEIRQLYESREMIEGGVARAAARAATEDDLIKLEMICDEMEASIGHYGSDRWADLDHKFHEAMADASHHSRFSHLLKSLLAECHYVFYLYLARRKRPHPSESDASRLMQCVVELHRELVAVLRQRDSEAAERVARKHMQSSADRATKTMISNHLRVEDVDSDKA